MTAKPALGHCQVGYFREAWQLVLIVDNRGVKRNVVGKKLVLSISPFTLYDLLFQGSKLSFGWNGLTLPKELD